MSLDSESSGAQDPQSRFGAWLRPWVVHASVAGLIALAAAVLLYRRLRNESGATAFISGFKAAGIVGLAVYAELRVAVLVVEWMARPH
jgi:hypothetical protein